MPWLPSRSVCLSVCLYLRLDGPLAFCAFDVHGMNELERNQSFPPGIYSYTNMHAASNYDWQAELERLCMPLLILTWHTVVVESILHGSQYCQ